LEIVEDKNKRTGLIASILFHTVLLVLFAIFGLSYMEPAPEEEGITINFGTSDEGMLSEVENTPSEQPAETQVETNVAEPTPEETVEEEIITQSLDEAPSIDKKEEKKEEVKPIEKKVEPKPNKALSLAERMKSSNKNEGGGDGQTGKPGDQGDLNGDANSKNYTGGGAGNGISFNLSGRNLLSSPKIQDNSQDEGTVVVDIIVDKYGKVLRATPGARGSTTTSSVLYKKAKEAAIQLKFNANPDAAEEQKGQVTFKFILN